MLWVRPVTSITTCICIQLSSSTHDILIDVSMSLRQSDLSFFKNLIGCSASWVLTNEIASIKCLHINSRSRLHACFQFPIYIILLLENNKGYKLQCIYISSCTWSVFPINIHRIQALNTNIFKIVGSIFMLN